MVSAQRLARDRGASLAVLWKRDHHLSARFDDLFVKPDDIRTVLTIRSESLHRCLNAIVGRVFTHSLEQPDVEAMNRAHADYVRYAAGRSVFIRTHSRFHCESDFSLIEPLPEITRAVDAYGLEGLGAVGVHIRRTDHTRSIEHSPTQLFLDAMREEMSQNPGTVFFVATDSAEEERLLQRAFPGRIIVHPKVSLDRSEPRAIRDAMVDLYCLARCRKLLGSYWSSFTDTAAALGGMPLQIVRKPEAD
jgi:hypothetical protein